MFLADFFEADFFTALLAFFWLRHLDLHATGHHHNVAFVYKRKAELSFTYALKCWDAHAGWDWEAHHT